MNGLINSLTRLIGIANTSESFDLRCDEFQFSCIANQICKDSYFKSLGLDFYIDIFDEEVPTYKNELGFNAIGSCILQDIKYVSQYMAYNFAKLLLDGNTYSEPSKEAFVARLTLICKLLLRSKAVKIEDLNFGRSHMQYKRAKETVILMNYFIREYPYDREELSNGKPT